MVKSRRNMKKMVITVEIYDGVSELLILTERKTKQSKTYASYRLVGLVASSLQLRTTNIE